MLTQEYAPDFVSPPGETLADVLEEQGMTQADLARRAGLSKKTVNRIVKGKEPITPETALKLERVLGIPARFWLAREQHYREFLAAAAERDSLEAQIKWIEQFPIRDMVRKGWLPDLEEPVEMFRALLNFFGVASPSEWQTVWERANETVFRHAKTFESNPFALAAWLRRGELQARLLSCGRYNKERFYEALVRIRALTYEMAEGWQDETVRLCADAGVAVAFVPQLPGTHVNGATRWLSPHLALLQVSLRYKTDDQFWFSFFHEAGHILLHGKREVFLEVGNVEEQARKEEEANRFAEDFLIPRAEYQRFVESGLYNYLEEVEAFAERLQVAPGIVVGRLQHDGYLPMRVGNRLKRKLVWEGKRGR